MLRITNASVDICKSMTSGSLDRKDKRSSWAASSITGGGSTGGDSFTTGNDGNTGGHAVSGPGTSNMLDTFPPVTLTVSSFFKQVTRNFYHTI